MTDALGTASYSHDAVGRVTSATDSQGFTVGYTYDGAGNLETITYPGGNVVTYAYDELNRLKTVTDWLTNTATYHYDDAGRLDYAVNFNGTVTDYTYDNANRLVTLEEKTALVGGDVIADYHYTLDANGNRIQEVQNEPQAPSATASATDVYDYNPERNRLTQAGATTFAYDHEGQLNDKSGAAYTFDYEHRLVAIGTTDQFSYDGAGRRLQAVRSGATTKYVYDLAGNVIAESNGAVITRYYIHGLGLMAMVLPAGESYNSYTYHYNGVGSTVAMTDANKEIVNSYAYSPFGELLAYTIAVSQPFMFVGKYGVTAQAGGLYYMRARYYDPAVGRFISEDPIGFAGGDVNLFGYVGNNPTLGIDPSGLSGLLAIYSSGSGNGSSGSGGISGHSWISYTPDGSATTTTYGTWGNNPMGLGNGLHENLEAGRTGDATRSAHINDTQEQTLFNVINSYKQEGEDGWGLLAPCSSFACNAWNASTGENLNPYGPYSNPSTLMDSINNANSGAGSCHR